MTFPEKSQVVAPPNGAKTKLFVISILILCALAVLFVLGITFLRPEADNTALIGTVIGVIVPVVMALLAGTVQQIGFAVDGRLSQFLAATARAERAEGKLEVVAAVTNNPAVANAAAPSQAAPSTADNGARIAQHEPGDDVR